MLVVRAARETDAVDVVDVRLRETVEVVELQPAGFGAPMTIFADECTSAAIPQKDGTFDGIRDVG
jgi:hypothetical protein